MRKRFLLRLASAIAALALPLFFASCSGDENKTVAVESVAVTPATLPLTVGTDQALAADVLPTNASNKDVSWTFTSVPATGVVTVSAAGLVTAVGNGTATVTATSVADATKKGECAVTVTTPVASVELPGTLDLFVGGTPGQLTANVLPATASNKSVTWAVTGGVPVPPATAVVSVSATGLVTAVGNGTATVTATSAADDSKKADCQVRVTTPVASVTVEPAGLALKPGESGVIVATVLPPTASNPALVWDSDNKDVCKPPAGLARVRRLVWRVKPVGVWCSVMKQLL
jgi:uncharacterized protein YjdB